MLVLSVSQRATPACRTEILGGARITVLAHLHPRHKAKSKEAEACKNNRAGGDPGEDRLYAAAYCPLWSEWNLCQRTRRQGRQGTWWHLRYGRRKLRAAGPLGGRSRATATRL